MFKDRVLSLVADHAGELRQLLAEGHADRCFLCPAVEFDGHEIEYDGYWAIYEHECPLSGCTGTNRVNEFGVEVTASNGSVVHLSEIERMRCSGPGCRTSLGVFYHHRTPAEVETYHLEIPKVLNTRIHEHHVSYEPEATVRVCNQCHRTIHADNGRFEALEPDQSRTEWES